MGKVKQTINIDLRKIILYVLDHKCFGKKKLCQIFGHIIMPKNFSISYKILVYNQ